MRKFILIFGLIVSIGSFQFAFAGQYTGNEPLFRIIDNGRTGYINASGKVVIEPKFRSAGNFSDGLAPARLNGTYGYIDQAGNFSITPAYDFATDFSEGFAIVYRNGKPAYIDKNGNEPFPVDFASIGSFYNGFAEVRTATSKMGIINKQGQLVIDTVFSSISSFQNGVAVVRSLREKFLSGDDNENPKVGVINLKGHFIVPYGKFSEIGDFINGYACFKIPAESEDEEGITARSGVINEKGDVLFSINRKNQAWLDGQVHDGLVKLYLYKNPKKIKTQHRYDDLFQGYINLKGEIVISDTTFQYGNDFSENRAFVRDRDNNYFLINTQGKLVTTQSFNQVSDNGFQNGMAFVETDEGWGAIDQDGNFIIKPIFDEIDREGLRGGYLFFSEEQDDGKTLYGVATKNGEVIIKPQLNDFSRAGFQNGLLSAEKNRKLCYLNTKGEIIWQEKTANNKKDNLNIDFMNRGYFQAYSRSSGKNKNELGGFATSSNFPQKLGKKEKHSENQLLLLAQPTSKTHWFEDYNGFKLLLINNTKKSAEFEAQDSRISIKIQAKDYNGKWKDIEYLPSSWCGNSYHTVTLDPKHYWTFTAPVYEGEFKTKLRAELKYPDPSDKLSDKEKAEREQREIAIYSNEFEGSVNPGQFWRKREYFPNGIMDPYNE